MMLIIISIANIESGIIEIGSNTSKLHEFYGLPCLTDLSECRKIVYLHSQKKCNEENSLLPAVASADRSMRLPQPETSYPPLIRQAEYWAEACPDSAIACLDSIDASLQELTEEERMYCHMLRIKAEDKLYIPHTSDSLINRIVRFYEQQGDDRRLAEALYYKAGVYRDCNEPSRAIRTYLSAAEVGCNHDTLNGRIYGQLAALYAYQKAYHES